MNKITLGLIISAACLGGCATTPPVTQSYGADGYDSAPQDQAPAGDDVDLMPPLPSFSSAADCERAYPDDPNGGCASGEAVYISAGLPPPPGAATWFIPYTFGLMTNVLVESYFAPPAPYIVGVRYETFASVNVIDNYKHITRRTIDAYHHSPLSVQRQTFRAGPVRYSPAHGTISAAPRRPAPPALTPTLPYRSVATTQTTPANVAPRPIQTVSHTSAPTPTPARAPTPTYRPPAHVASSSYVAPSRPAPVSTPPRRTCVPKAGGGCQ